MSDETESTPESSDNESAAVPQPPSAPAPYVRPAPQKGELVFYSAEGGEEAPAIVTAVNADGSLSLHVFSANAPHATEGVPGWRRP
jgi:hypothetical protein